MSHAFRRLTRVKNDGRNRASSFWIPTGGIAKSSKVEDANDLLVRAGFLRQVSSGVFHLLPLGLRVQEKLESLIDKHMRSLGASKLSLSSLSLQSLWKKSGRLTENSEVLRFQDRKGTRFLLAPTHEEEITTLVGGLVKSYRDVPLRVYQISRKYRDEPRPRQGLLRAKEFIMKDLYTFDYNVPTAMDTYNSVKDVYVRLFDELKLPYLVAAADSGNMGGNLSHEFHIPSPKGDDTVISCSSCKHTFNQEVVDGKASPSRKQMPNHESPNVAAPQHAPETVGRRTFISEDRRTLVRSHYPKYLTDNEGSREEARQVNPYAVRSISHAHGVELDLGVQAPLEAWQGALERLADQESEVEGGKGSQVFTVLDIFDFRVPAPDSLDPPELLSCDISDRVAFNWVGLDNYPGTSNLLDLVEPKSGDVCPECGEKSLQVQTTIELAHTFHLGTRYSGVLDATVGANPAALGETTTTGSSNAIVPLQMGCHGIGVSRMISAVADALADSSGLNWPRVIAPFEVAVIPAKGLEKEAEGVYDAITTHHRHGAEAILDDRDKPMGWKLGDGDLIGYPILVVVGQAWRSERKVEVQCRRPKVSRTTVSLDELPGLLASLLEKL